LILKLRAKKSNEIKIKPKTRRGKWEMWEESRRKREREGAGKRKRTFLLV